MKELIQQFHLMDTNKDGKISREEFTECMKTHSDMLDDEDEDVDELFDNLD